MPDSLSSEQSGRPPGERSAPRTLETTSFTRVARPLGLLYKPVEPVFFFQLILTVGVYDPWKIPPQVDLLRSELLGLKVPIFYHPIASMRSVPLT